MMRKPLLLGQKLARGCRFKYLVADGFSHCSLLPLTTSSVLDSEFLPVPC